MKAPRVYLILQALTSLASSIMFTTYALYYITILHLNPFQLVLVGTVIEVTILIFESITGVVADTYSRRLSVIIGTIVLGIAFIFEGSIPYFSTMISMTIPFIAFVIIAEIIRGIGETFVSGADRAWVTDEVGENNIGPVFLRSNQLNHVASIIGIFISILFASISLNLPYIIGGILYIALGVFLIIYMKETNFQPERRSESNFGAMIETMKDGLNVIKKKPILILLLGVGIFTGAASEGFDRLWEAHFLDAFTFPKIGITSTVVWFGIINFVASLLSIIATEIYKRKVDTNNHKLLTKSLVILSILHILFMTMFAISYGFMMAVVSFWAIIIITSMSRPLYDTWINQNIESRSRATVLSILSQTDAIGQAGGGPIIGYIGTRFTIRIAMIAVAIFLSPIFLLYYNASKMNKEKNSTR